MKDEIKEIMKNMKEWSVDGNLYFEINDEKAKLLYNYITHLRTIEQQYSAILNENAELENKITNLEERLEVSQTNEETYRLEMLDITKCLGLDEDTIFDEVKEKATILEEIRKEHSIMKQFIYENRLWEKLLNDDRFLDHLRSDDNE